MRSLIMRSLLFLPALVLFSCGESNKFGDETLRKIYTLQDERKARELEAYLNDGKVAIRKEAILALASVQDTGSLKPLLGLLKDDDEEIRADAAYALGQLKYPPSAPKLVEAIEAEKALEVRAVLMIALGKAGNPAALGYLDTLNYYQNDSLMGEAQAWAYFHLGNKKIISEKGTKKMTKLIDEKMADRVRLAASAYLGRARGIELKTYIQPIVKCATGDKNVFVRMNAARALGKVNEDAVLLPMDIILQYDKDYRVKVNATYALRSFNYQLTGPRLLRTVMSDNVHIATAAAEVMLDKGDSTDVKNYLEKAGKIKHWRARALLYAAALKYANDTDRTAINEQIMKAYQGAENVYEKGMLLSALGNDIGNHAFIANETVTRQGLVLSTYGMEALITIRKNPKFGRKEKSDSLFRTFDNYFKAAIGSDHISLVALATGIMRDTTINAPPTTKGTFRIAYDDYSFLTAAQKKMQLPRDIETYIEIQKTIDFYKGTETKEPPKAPFNNPIDWELVQTIRENQEVLMKTTKGDIKVKLFINEAPGSVANFIKLMKKGFYTPAVFHRVVPNFVVQAGCPRGDGWGNSDETIRSEFYPLNYGEGYLGMASAGKDTEGSQWFITHSPTPHLDGGYSIFGKVSEGLDVLQQLEMGDKVTAMELLP